MSRELGPLEIISDNLLISQVVPQGIAPRNPDLIVGDRYLTRILPDYADIFRRTVKIIIGGLILSSYAETPLPDGEVLLASVFGVCTDQVVSIAGQDCHFFVPNVHKAFLPLLGLKPMDAIHGYHVDLVEQINYSLEAASPYRLATLPRE